MSVFYQHFKYFLVCTCCLYVFWWEVHCNSYYWFSICKVHIFCSSDFLKDFVFSFVKFKYYTGIVLFCICLAWFSLSFHDLWLVDCVNFRKFLAIIISNIAFLSFFSFIRHYSHILNPWNYLIVLGLFVLCLVLSFLIFSFSSFYLRQVSVDMFSSSDSFFQCIDEPIKDILHFCYNVIDF